MKLARTASTKAGTFGMPSAFFTASFARTSKAVSYTQLDVYKRQVVRGDTEGMKRQTAANLRFFDAPVALMLTIDRDLEIGSWLDLGMFIQTLLIAAQGHGLDSCPQAIFAQFHPIVRRELAIPEDEVVVCGIAIGKADPDAPANRLVPEREPVEGFTTWLD